MTDPASPGAQIDRALREVERAQAELNVTGRLRPLTQVDELAKENAERARKAKLAETRWHRLVVAVALAIAAVCVESAVWLSPMPTYLRLMAQGVMAVVVAVGALYLTDVQR